MPTEYWEWEEGDREPDTWFDDEGYEDDEDDLDAAIDNCHWNGKHGSTCGAIGSEDCDWECPFSSEMWLGLRTLRDERGRFAKRKVED